MRCHLTLFKVGGYESREEHAEAPSKVQSLATDLLSACENEPCSITDTSSTMEVIKWVAFNKFIHAEVSHFVLLPFNAFY